MKKGLHFLVFFFMVVGFLLGCTRSENLSNENTIAEIDGMWLAIVDEDGDKVELNIFFNGETFKIFTDIGTLMGNVDIDNSKLISPDGELTLNYKKSGNNTLSIDGIVEEPIVFHKINEEQSSVQADSGLNGTWEGTWAGSPMVIIITGDTSFWYGSWAGSSVNAKFKYENDKYIILDNNGNPTETWSCLLKGDNYLLIDEDVNVNLRLNINEAEAFFERVK